MKGLKKKHQLAEGKPVGYLKTWLKISSINPASGYGGTWNWSHRIEVRVLTAL